MREFIYRFRTRLALRVALVALGFLASTAMLAAGPFYISGGLLAAFALLQVWALYRTAARANRDLGQFFDSLRHDDYSRRFNENEDDAGFGELYAAFNGVLERLSRLRREEEAQRRFLEALALHVALPLVVFDREGRIALQNHAFRKLAAPARVEKLDDLPEERRWLAGLLQGPADELNGRLAPLARDGVKQTYALSVTDVVVRERPLRIATFQNITEKLDATEAEAWQKLMRVLTHEIMNSLTPIVSLAGSLSDLLEEDPEAYAEDLRRGLATIQKRGDGLGQFVESYRSFYQLPKPSLEQLTVADVFGRMESLFANRFDEAGAELALEQTQPNLAFRADARMLDQILVNLLDNALAALAEAREKRATLRAALTSEGRLYLEVSDTGPGMEADTLSRVFVPFFTTKNGGSGVGLALARQYARRMGANLSARAAPGKGAAFRLTF